MKKVELGKTGVYVSEVSLGCMLMGSATDRAASFEMLDRFVAAGGDFLDTANCYAWWIGQGEFVGDESETLVGQWLTGTEEARSGFPGDEGGRVASRTSSGFVMSRGTCTGIVCGMNTNICRHV